MSCSSKVSRTFEYLCIFRADEKIQAKWLRAAEKNKEKVEANCTGFSAKLSSLVLGQWKFYALSGKWKFQYWQLLAGAWQKSTNVFLNP